MKVNVFVFVVLYYINKEVNNMVSIQDIEKFLRMKNSECPMDSEKTHCWCPIGTIYQSNLNQVCRVLKCTQCHNSLLEPLEMLKDVV